jgi:anti-sigma B factor antagonist
MDAHRRSDSAVGALYVSTSGGNGIATVRVVGDIDIATAGRLRDHVENMLRDGIEQVVLELSEVSFMDAAGLGVLVGLSNSAAGREVRLLVGGMSAAVSRLLRITCLEERLAGASPPLPLSRHQ